MSRTVSDIGTAEFNELLAEAENNTENDWEAKFIDDMQDRYKKYGDKTFVSENQWSVLRRIAQGDQA